MCSDQLDSNLQSCMQEQINSPLQFLTMDQAQEQGDQLDRLPSWLLVAGHIIKNLIW